MSLLSPLTDEQRDQIGDALEERQFAKDETIVEQGAAADSLFLIKEGEVTAYIKESDGDGKRKEAASMKEVARMHRGEFFGESSLSGDASTKRAASVIAADSATILILSHDRRARSPSPVPAPGPCTHPSSLPPFHFTSRLLLRQFPDPLTSAASLQ